MTAPTLKRVRVGKLVPLLLLSNEPRLSFVTSSPSPLLGEQKPFVSIQAWLRKRLARHIRPSPNTRSIPIGLMSQVFLIVVEA